MSANRILKSSILNVSVGTAAYAITSVTVWGAIILDSGEPCVGCITQLSMMVHSSVEAPRAVNFFQSAPRAKLA